MKRILSFALLIALLASFPSCKNDREPSPVDSDTLTPVTEGAHTDGMDTTAFEETSAETESTPASSESNDSPSEEDQIKNRVLALMETSDTRTDPSELFAHFSGDFKITQFSSSSGVQAIRRREAVTLINADAYRYYGIEAAGHLFYAGDYNSREAYLYGVLPLSADAAYASTIFTVFGIDTGALYTGTTVEEDTAETLTADMLTVSDDKTSCEFAKSYVDTLAKEICQAMGFSSVQTSSFLGKYTGSGIYSVAENKITFDIQFKDSQLGTIHQISKYGIDGEGEVYAYSYMEYSNKAAGISTPIITEIEWTDVEYREGEPIRATITLNTSSGSSFRDGSVLVKIKEQIETSFQLDCSDLETRSAHATRKVSQTETVRGETMTYTKKLSLSIDLGRSSSQFQFTERRDNENVTSLKANRLEFGTSSAIVTPQRVLDVITDYIDENFE